LFQPDYKYSCILYNASMISSHFIVIFSYFDFWNNIKEGIKGIQTKREDLLALPVIWQSMAAFLVSLIVILNCDIALHVYTSLYLFI